MRIKKKFYTELSYILGLIILAFGTALMKKSDFGLSMVVAPAYIFHLKISQYFPFFSFGMAEYCFQAVLLVILVICFRKFKYTYLFSFITAFLYGLLLDLAIFIINPLPTETLLERSIYYIIGLPLSSLSIALFFKTYITPEAYEVVVKEISNNLNIEIGKVKTAYDCISCVLSIVLSFSFFGLFHFEGVKLGTVVCALINGFLISKIGKFLDYIFDFKDGLNLRKKFEK